VSVRSVRSMVRTASPTRDSRGDVEPGVRPAPGESPVGLVGSVSVRAEDGLGRRLGVRRVRSMVETATPRSTRPPGSAEQVVPVRRFAGDGRTSATVWRCG
jgi:hypothetical protein